MKVQDLPEVLEYVYITTVEEANEWAVTALTEHIPKYITTDRIILTGMYALWNTQNHRDTTLANDGESTTIEDASSQLRLLQISIPRAPVAVIDFAALRRNASNDRVRFPESVKKLLELPTLIVCAVEANTLVDSLLRHCKVNCLERADLVDMAQAVWSYQEGYEPNHVNLVRNSLPIPVMLEELCYHFLGLYDRDELLRLERPSEEPPNVDHLLSDDHVRYYAAHAYHARLLADTMIEMVSLAEYEMFHEDDEAYVYLSDPKIPFHPTMDRVPEMLSYGKKVAVLNEVDDWNEDRVYQSTGSKKHQILATGKLVFVGEPFGITKRFPGTSYLVGRHEEEAIVRLVRVRCKEEPVPLCRGHAYWKDKSPHGDPILDWPDPPTLGWVLKNVEPPWIVVEKDRLELLHRIDDLPTEKTWLPKKKRDTLPPIPVDMSKFL